MANTLNLGTDGNWATKEGSLLGYNSENNNYKPLPFTFDRASSATRVNKDGLIETVGADQPRIDYLNDSKGALLLEPQRTNSLVQSNQFDTTWSKSGGVTLTSEQAISPQGINNGWKFEKTAAAYKSIGQSYTSSSETTFSIFAKKGTLSVITLFTNISGGTNLFQRFDLENGTISSGSGMSNSNIEDFGNGWYRCSSTFTNANVISLDFFPEFGEANAGYIYIYGAQAEQGNYATSYIPTQGSAVTRLADVCNNGGNDQVINSTEGVLYFEGSALANDGTNRLISLSDGTADERLFLQYSSTDNRLQFLVKNSGSTQCNIIYDASDLTAVHKVAAKYKLNDFALWVDGVEIGTNTSGNVASGLNQLQFDRGYSGLPFYGNVKDVKLYNTALTDQELASLTQV